MVNIVRTRRNSMGGGSPKSAEVGEIDTKAPFESVRAAVSLFGSSSSTSPKAKSKPGFIRKTKSQVIEVQDVLDKEAQFHIALNELNKLKEQLRGAESARAETLPELDRAKRTLEELREKLTLVNQSKQSIVEASDALKTKAVEDAETKREDGYKAAVAELDAAKQELSNMRREFDATSEAKIRTLRKSQQAELAADAHRERVKELSKQVTAMQEALAQIKAPSEEAVEEHARLLAQKDEELQCRRLAKEEVEKKMATIKEENVSLLEEENLEVKLAEVDVEIASLQEEVKNARTAFLEAQKATSFELEISKESLKQIEEEKMTLQSSMESLKRELELVGKELSEQKVKQEELDGLVNKIKGEIEDKKNELEAGVVNKTTAANVSDDMAASLEQLAIETQKAKENAEEIKKRTAEQLELVKKTREMTKEMEDKLPCVLKQVEEAKESETAAQEEIKVISQKDVEGESNETNGKIKLSNEEYNALMEKVNESENLADIKVAAAMAHVEALVASQQEAAKKYEAYSKAIEELKMAEEEALKTAEMAEAATHALEAELNRIHLDESDKIVQLNC